MDLIYTVTSDKPLETASSKCFVISRDNGITFTTREGLRRTDPNVPWDASIRKTSSEIRTLVGNPDGTRILTGDDTALEIYDETDNLLGRTTSFAGESFPASGFFKRREPVYLNAPEQPSLYDKFRFSTSENEDEDCALVVGASGIIIGLRYNRDSKNLDVLCRSLDDGHRTRIEVADMARSKDGKFLVAASNGHPEGPVKTYEVSLKEDKLKAGSYASLFPRSGGTAVTSLHFINPDDCDALLVGMKTESGAGRVEMWELKETISRTHKILSSAGASSPSSNGGLPVKRIVSPIWVFAESFGGPSSEIVAMRSPGSSLVVSGKSSSPSCYLAVAYADGSIQCLLRDSLQQIESVDLPRINNISDEPKMARVPVSIMDMAFTSTGNALIVVDSFGQLYLYRMSPISDPGGPHTVPYAVTMFEYCLVSGRDWWDLLICIKPNMVEAVCDKLTESYQRQTPDIQRYLFGKYMAMKMSIYRLNSATEYKAADVFASLMITSIFGAFESLLRPTELFELVPTIYKLQVVLQNNPKGEWDIDKLVKRLEAVHKEFNVDPQILQSLQQLIQWTSCLALHMMASIPEYKSRKGPGYDLINDKKILNTLRELLLLIRIWGSQKPSCLPAFTKTLDNFDVIAKVFALVTKFSENPNDESILDDCLLLPSQVMIPPMNCRIPARGVLAACRTTPISYEFGVEPQLQTDYGGSFESIVIEGSMGTFQSIDIIRYIFLGCKPQIVKACSRCCGVTLAQNTIKNSPTKSWDKRWLRGCPCGGYWKLKVAKS